MDANSVQNSGVPKESSSQNQNLEIIIKTVRSLIQDLTSIEPFLNEDFYLLQWLKARKMKPEGTASAIRKAIEWRVENGYYDLARDEELWAPEPKYNIFLDADIVDKNGIAVVYAPMGSWDVRKFVEELGRAAFVQFMTRSFLAGEKLMVESNRKRRAANSSCSSNSATQEAQIESVGTSMICDGSGYSLKQAASIQTILAALDCAKIYDNYFPRNVDNIYFINAGSVFSKILRMVEPFMGVAKMEIFNITDTQNGLLSVIDSNQLPKALGGTKAD